MGKEDTAPADALEQTIGDALDRLIRGRRRGRPGPSEGALNDAAAAIRSIAHEPGALQALDRALAAKPKRASVKIWVLCGLLHSEGGHERARLELTRLDEDERWSLVQSIGARHDPSFLPILDEVFASDPSRSVRRQAFQSISQLPGEAIRASLAVRSLLPSPPGDLSWPFLWAMRQAAMPEAAAFVRECFDKPLNRRDAKVVAAWALAKLGDREGLAYLDRQLDDAENEMRAAQAIADLRGWPFEWDRGNVPALRERWRSEHESE